MRNGIVLPSRPAPRLITFLNSSSSPIYVTPVPFSEDEILVKKVQILARI